VLPAFFTWELFPAAVRRATNQFDVSLGTSCHDPPGGGGQVEYSRTSVIYLHPRHAGVACVPDNSIMITLDVG
jgi:hypothetical protein